MKVKELPEKDRDILIVPDRQGKTEFTCSGCKKVVEIPEATIKIRWGFHNVHCPYCDRIHSCTLIYNIRRGKPCGTCKHMIKVDNNVINCKRKSLVGMKLDLNPVDDCPLHVTITKIGGIE